ncbi:MAG: tetratricopeptide repeat protein [Candidatus Eisenbacteria bacterium]
MNHTLRNLARVTLFVILSAALVSVSTTRVRADELKDGRTALAAGHYDEALQLFEKASGQGYAEGRAGVGQVWLRRRNYEKALEAFEMSQKMDPNLAMSYWGLGEVARRNEDYAAALPNFKRATELDRKFPEAQLAMGDCLTQLKRFDEAVTALNPGLNWGPKWKPRFLVELGFVEMGRDSLRDAGIYFTQAREAAPEDPITNRALGDFYLKRGIGALAIPEYEKAVGLDSTDIDLRFALGRALAFDQRYDEAIEQYKWVADKNPDFAGAQLALGDIYYRAGQAKAAYYQEARPFLEKYTQLAPNDPKGWSLLGRDLFFLRDKDAALTALQKAMDLGDKSKDMYTVLFRVKVDKKDWQGALDAIRNGEPNNTDVLKLAQVHAFLGNAAAADSVYQSLIERDSTSSDARFALLERAKTQYRLKDYPNAISTLQRRIALDGTSDEAYYYLGLSHKELKQLPEAITALRQAATLAPTKGDRHFWLAVTLTQADSIDAALAGFRAVVAVDSTSKNASVSYQQLGYRPLLKKDWQGAIENLERSAAIDPKNLQSLVWLAQAYQNSGNREKAREYYRKVLEIQPGEPNATKGLKTLGE